jgi:hypothetical protein
VRWLDWEFVVANDDRDELFVEFWHNGEHVAEAYPDVERRRFVLTLFPRSDGAWWTFPLDEFQEAVRRGVARLEERGYPDPLPPASAG